MNIVHVIDSGGFYGKERVVAELSTEQTNHGDEVTIINIGGDIPELDNLVTKTKGLSMWTLYTPRGIFRNGGYIANLKNCISDIKPDIVHVHGIKESIMVLLAGLHGAKLVKTVHGYTATKKYSKGWFKIWLDRLLYILHNKVVGVSENMEKDFGIKTIVPNGIKVFAFNHDAIEPEIAEFCKDSYVFLCTARISPEKNIGGLIDAMKLLKEYKYNAKLLILGDGQLLEMLKEEVKDKFLDDVIMFAGYVSNASDYLSLAKVYVQPSFTEGTPITVLEAMSVGMPMILSYVGGMKKIYNEGVCWRCDITPKSIASVMEYFAKNKLIQFNHGALELFKKKYSSIAMHDSYDEIYKNLM